MATRSGINISSQFSLAVVQGGADAFVQGSVSTGLLNRSDNNAIRIIQIDVEMPPLVIAAACELEAAWCRRSQAAMPDLDNDNVIKKWRWRNVFSSAVGSYFMDRVATWIPSAGDIIVVEDPLYFVFDSTATGGANAVRTQVFYEFVKITEVERLSLIARSLGG